MNPIRMKKRYIAVQVVPEGHFSKREVLRAILYSLRSSNEATSEIGLRFLEYDSVGGRGILRCWHRALPILRSSLLAVKAIGNEPGSIKVLGLSGTIRKLRKKYGV